MMPVYSGQMAALGRNPRSSTAHEAAVQEPHLVRAVHGAHAQATVHRTHCHAAMKCPVTPTSRGTEAGTELADLPAMLRLPGCWLGHINRIIVIHTWHLNAH